MAPGGLAQGKPLCKASDGQERLELLLMASSGTERDCATLTCSPATSVGDVGVRRAPRGAALGARGRSGADALGAGRCWLLPGDLAGGAWDVRRLAGSSGASVAIWLKKIIWSKTDFS